MTSRQPKRLLNSVAVAGLLLSTGAAAAPGDHIRAGNLTVTPSLSAGFQYRSNAFRQTSNPQGAGNGVLTPAVVAKLQSKDVSFELNGRYGLQKYLFLTNVDDPAARRQRISALDRFNNVNLGTGFKVTTQPVGVHADFALALVNNPSDLDLNSDDPYTTQFRNELNTGIDFSPGPALQISPGFSYTWTQYFVPTTDAVRDPFNARNSYQPTLDVVYRFLPRTSFVANASYSFNRWADNAPEAGDGAIQVNDSDLGRVTAGVQGRLTERLKVVLSAGTGFGKFSDGLPLGALPGLIAVVSGTYDVLPEHSVTVGYRKSFFDSFFTNSVSVSSFEGRWNGKYGEKLSSNLALGTRFERYDGDSVDNRRDQVTRLNAGLAYKFNSWAGMGVDGGWLQRRSTATAAEYDDIRAGVNAVFTY